MIPSATHFTSSSSSVSSTQIPEFLYTSTKNNYIPPPPPPAHTSSNAPNTAVWVGRFPEYVSKSKLYKDFGKYGKIESLFKLQSMCALVNYCNVESATNAIKHLNNTYFYPKVEYHTRRWIPSSTYFPQKSRDSSSYVAQESSARKQTKTVTSESSSPRPPKLPQPEIPAVKLPQPPIQPQSITTSNVQEEASTESPKQLPVPPLNPNPSPTTMLSDIETMHNTLEVYSQYIRFYEELLTSETNNSVPAQQKIAAREKLKQVGASMSSLLNATNRAIQNSKPILNKQLKEEQQRKLSSSQTTTSSSSAPTVEANEAIHVLDSLQFFAQLHPWLSNLQ